MVQETFPKPFPHYFLLWKSVRKWGGGGGNVVGATKVGSQGVNITCTQIHIQSEHTESQISQHVDRVRAQITGGVAVNAVSQLWGRLQIGADVGNNALEEVKHWRQHVVTIY